MHEKWKLWPFEGTRSSREHTAFHTSENIPSPNHSTLRMPVGEDFTFQGITNPGHQGNPSTFPHTSSPVRKPFPSCRGEFYMNQMLTQLYCDLFPIILPDSFVSGVFLVSVYWLVVILHPAPAPAWRRDIGNWRSLHSELCVSVKTSQTRSCRSEILRKTCMTVERRSSALFWEYTSGNLPSLLETLHPFCCPYVGHWPSTCRYCQPETLYGPGASGANCPPSQNSPYWLPGIE